MAYKTLDEAFKDTFTTPARTVSMDEALKATFGEAPPKSVGLDEAFENTFGRSSQPVPDSPDFEAQIKAMKAAGMTNEQIKAQFAPDKLPGASRYVMSEPGSIGGKALDYAKRALLGVDTGLANSMSSMYQGAGALADAIVHYANAPYNYVAEKTGLPQINTNGNPVTRLLLDQGEKVGGLAQRFSDEALQGRDPSLFDQTAQGVGSTAGFFLPGLVSAGSSALPGAIGKAGAFATTAGGLEALSEGGSAYAEQLKQGASLPEARSAFAKTGILNLPIDIATDAIGTVLGGGSVVRKALARGFSEMTQETLQGVLSGITSQRKPDGTPYTWGDLVQAAPEMAKAVPETLRNEGVPAFLSSMLIGAGEGIHGKVAARQEARAQAKSLMTLDEAFEAMRADVSASSSRGGNPEPARTAQASMDPRVTKDIAEEKGMQTRHQRFPADPPASSEGALLHRPGEGNIAPGKKGVNNGVPAQALADQRQAWQEAPYHAMDRDVDLGRRVPVKVLPTADKKTLGVEDGAAIIRAFGKEGIENSDTGAHMTLARRGADHIRYTANSRRGEEKMALISAFENLPEIARGAVRVKTTEDRKPKGRQSAENSGVRSVQRFLAPVRYGESVYVLKLTAKEIANGRLEIDIDPSDPRVIKLYDQSIAKKISGNTSDGGGKTGSSSTAVLPDSQLSVGEMAVDVKDTLDERPYLTREEYEARAGKKYPYGEDAQRLAAPTDERRFFEPEKPMREPLKIDEATIRAHQFAAPSTPGTRENALGWIRKNGGLDYRAIRDSYGKEEALQLRKRLGPGMFKTDGMPLDKAAQGLSLEGAPGLDSDTALFQTLMGEGAGKTRRVVDKAAPMQSGVQALADRGAPSHAMDKDVDLGTRVPIFNVPVETRRTITTKDRQAMSAQFGNGIKNDDTGLNVTLSIGRGGAGHIAHTAFDEEGDAKQALIAAFFRLPEIVQKARRVKINPGRKETDLENAGNAGNLKAMHRFLFPMRYGNDLYVLKLTAKEFEPGRASINLADPRAAEIRLYDQKIGKKISGVSSASKGINPDRPTVETAPDTDISLGEMAVDVKDTLDERPYLTREEYEARAGKKYPYGEDAQRLAAPTNKRRFFEPEKPMREPLKIDEATIRAHQFTARPVPESVSNISFKGRPEEEIRSIARARVDELAQQTFRGIEGEDIYFAPGQGEDWDSYTNHLISGMDGKLPNAERAQALWLVEETIARPVAVFEQKNGRRAYVGLYEDAGQQRAHYIVIQIGFGGRARSVTSLVSKDTGINSAKATNYLKSRIKEAADVLYLEGMSK